VLFRSFAVGLAGALLFGYIAVRLNVSPIIGYLLAGVAVGPFTPGIVVNHAVAEQFAEIGVILLLFGIGLRFQLRELIAVWRIALPGALIQSTLSTVALAGALRLLGWNWTSGLILGMAISVASTVVMALVLAEWGDLHARIGHIAIGWTVVEDILTVALLLLLPILFGQQFADRENTRAVLGVAGLKILGLVIVVAVLGKWGIPWAMEQIASTRSRELFTRDLKRFGYAADQVIDSYLKHPKEQARLKLYVLNLIGRLATQENFDSESESPIFYFGNKDTAMMAFRFYFKSSSRTFTPRSPKERLNQLVNRRMIEIVDGKQIPTNLRLPLIKAPGLKGDAP